jgi:hypothetical protein
MNNNIDQTLELNSQTKNWEIVAEDQNNNSDPVILINFPGQIAKKERESKYSAYHLENYGKFYQMGQ